MTRWIAVGKILRAHGVRGDVVVRRFGDAPEMLAPDAALRAGEGVSAVTLRVIEAKRHGRDWIVSFAGFEDREATAEVSGRLLFVEETSLPALPEGTYYRFQLVGLRVRTQGGEDLGRVEEILETGAHDVCVVRGERGEILIPAVDAMVASVDLEGGEMIVTPIPGLVPGTDEESGAGQDPPPRDGGGR